MGDWIGLGIIILAALGAFAGLARLGTPPKPMTQEEFEQKVQEGRGWMSAGAFAGMQALHKLMNPKAAEAVEVQKDLQAGYYDDQQEVGDGDEPVEPAAEEAKRPTEEGTDA